jgi:hypothetical protein
VLAAGERMETPMSQITLVRPSQLALGASAALEGTPLREPIVARARKLDERWTAEVAQVMKARQELYSSLSAEAELKWPRLRETFESYPVDPGYIQPGMLLRIDRIQNRAGWDFGGRTFNFAARVNGVVVAGSYAPHVLAALEHAWYQLRLEVNDRIPWDLLAIVEGPDTIGVRTNVKLRDASSGHEIGSFEDWTPTECMRVRIIGLHAGPIAVAQQG